VAAIFYSLLALERTGDPVYWHGASLVVALSIVLHGLTALPGIWLFRRRDRAAPPVPR